MKQAVVRSFRSHHQLPAGVVISPSNQVSREGRVPSSTGVSLRKVKAFCSNPADHNKHNMEKSEEPKDKKGDAMSHSFGDAYATRSNEEGFGGVYGGNDDDDDVKLDKKIHEDHPDYDKSQGSAVKEKEKARNQANGND